LRVAGDAIGVGVEVCGGFLGDVDGDDAVFVGALLDGLVAVVAVHGLG